MGAKCKITAVPNRLGKLLRQPGGITRDKALKAAGRNVQDLRQEFVAAIPGEIAALEEILAENGLAKIGPDALDAMLRRAGLILTLSGTYGLTQLDLVVKYFCDLAIGMIDKDIVDVAPVKIHLRAMRLVCPGAAQIPEAEVARVLSELKRLHTHYGIARGAQA